MGKFKKISISIEELIIKLIIITSIFSSILLLFTGVENEMLKEKIKILEQKEIIVEEK